VYDGIVRRLFSVVVLVVMGGCYEPPQDACGLSCTTSCPDGYTCTGGVCRPSDGSPCQGPSVDFAMIGVGARHACGLDNGGSVFCWGANDLSQVGLGTGAAVSVAIPTKVGDGFTALAVGALHACALRDGKALCWGDNQAGQAAGGTGGVVQIPTAVAAPADVPAFDHIAAGTRATCALANHELWCWGVARSLGNGNQPVSLATRIGTDADWADIALGDEYGCGITTTGGIRCWGANDHHEIDASASTTVLTPIDVALPGGLRAVRIFATSETTCAIAAMQVGATQGALYCWGRNDHDAPLPGGTDVLAPTQIGTDATWTYFTASYFYSCGITGGMALCWGTEREGEMGDGLWGSFEVPLAQATKLGHADEIHVSQLARDFNQSELTCLRAGASVSCMGENIRGELGIGVASVHATPTEVIPANGMKWKDVVAGNHHACATVSDGSLWCWGSNTYGAINAGVARGREQACVAEQPCDYPRPVAAPAGVGKPDEMIAGYEYTCTREGGTVHCWGNQEEGALGAGDSPGHNVTTVSSPDGPWTAIFGGERASCGATASGLACWGRIVGVNHNTPVAVMDPEILAPRDMSLSTDYACLTRSDGGRVCVGQNDHGQLGDMTTTSRSTAAVIEPMITATQSRSGHSCEIKNGNVYCWGNNYQAESGLPTGGTGYLTTPNAVHTAAANLTGCTQLALGDLSSCAICDPGGATVYCWGDNSGGQLGVGELFDWEENAMPVMLPAGRTWKKIVAGYYFACALDTGGQLFCWGEGDGGELGDGGGSRNLPTPVGMR
jgi:alpha-tubulin suppressor-like RCC1 family protein